MRFLAAVAVCSVVACASGPQKSGSAANVGSSADGSPQTVLLNLPWQYRAVFFKSEIPEIHDAAVKFLTARHPNWSVVSFAQMRAIASKADRGLADDGKIACIEKEAPRAALKRAFPDAMRATLYLRCKSDCTITITVQRPAKTGDHAEVARWSVEFPATADVATWLAQMDGLKPSKPTKGGYLAGMKNRKGQLTKVRVTEVRAVAHANIDAKFDHDALDKCWEYRNSSSSDTFSLALDSAGKVTQCERSHPHTKPHSPQFDCMCDALRLSRFGAGASARRAQVQLLNSVRPSKVIEGYTRLVVAKEWSKHGTFNPRSGFKSRLAEVESCFAGAKPGKRRMQPMLWTVLPDGTTKSFSLGESPTPISNEEAACARAALSQSRFTCTHSDEPVEVRAQLVIGYNKNKSGVGTPPARDSGGHLRGEQSLLRLRN